MSDLERAHGAAGLLRSVVDRAFGASPAADVEHTDVFSQIGRGEWDEVLARPGAAGAAADLMTAAAEQIKQVRRALELISQGENDMKWDPAYTSIAGAAESWLPANRKERYFTGTVLPFVAFSDGFAHTGRLLDLCGLAGIEVGGLTGDNRIQVFTEYSFAESVFLPGDRERFADRPPAADTPDLVLVGDGWLLAIEAKLYDAVSAADLRRQLQAQAVLVEYWRGKLELDPERVRHVALLPRRLTDRIGTSLPAPVVHWEDVAAAYRHVAPRYWIAALEHALAAELYADDSLVFGANAHAQLTGAEIVADAHVADTPRYTAMGRSGGINGTLLAADISTGAWRNQLYEVRTDGQPNRNWFPIAEFLQRVGDED